MTETTTIRQKTRLEALWAEKTADIAVAFCKQTITPEMTLDELRQVLTFVELMPHLNDIALRQVIALVPPHSQSTESRVLAQKAPKGSKKKRRRRRSSEEVQRLKTAVLQRVQASTAGSTINDLIGVLSNAGMSVDGVTVSKLLHALHSEGYLTYTQGKPNIWRPRIQGRLAPAPLIIRKAATIRDG